MKKSVLSILLVIVILLNLQTFAYASKELNNNQSAYKTISSQIKELDREISNINNDISLLQNTISKNEDEIFSIEKELTSLENSIANLNEEIIQNEDILSLRIREMYKSGSFGIFDIVSILFESNSFMEAIDKINAFNILIKLDKSLIDENKTKIEQIQNTSSNITAKKEELLVKNEEINLSITETKSKMAEVEEKKRKLTSEKSKIQDAIKENEESLVNNKIRIIYSSTSTMGQISSAVTDLRGLLPQITTPSVRNKVSAAITEGQNKLNSGNNNSGSGGTNDSYKVTYTMEATAYYGHTITAMGIKPVRDPNGISTVAVDRTVIPLGTKLYIPGYGYAMAADTGGAIKGKKIDLFMNTREECYNFGRRQITVHVIAYPGEW